MLPSKMEFAKFIMKVTLERPVDDELVDDIHSDIQVVEFWKRMGFEDIAEAGTEIDKQCILRVKYPLRPDFISNIETYWDYVRQFNPI